MTVIMIYIILFISCLGELLDHLLLALSLLLEEELELELELEEEPDLFFSPPAFLFCFFSFLLASIASCNFYLTCLARSSFWRSFGINTDALGLPALLPLPGGPLGFLVPRGAEPWRTNWLVPGMIDILFFAPAPVWAILGGLTGRLPESSFMFIFQCKCSSL